MTPFKAITIGCISTAICFSLIIRDSIHLTTLKMEVPDLQQSISKIDGNIQRLEVELDAFKSPIELIRLLKKPMYSHLIQPYENEVTIVRYSDVENNSSLETCIGDTKKDTVLTTNSKK